jgi:hypothetical protein
MTRTAARPTLPTELQFGPTADRSVILRSFKPAVVVGRGMSTRLDTDRTTLTDPNRPATDAAAGTRHSTLWDSDRTPRGVLRAVLAVLGLFAVSFVAQQLVAAGGIAAITASGFGIGFALAVVLLLPLTQTAMATVAVAYLRWHVGRIPVGRLSRRDLGWTLGALVGTVAFYVVWHAVIEASGIEQVDSVLAVAVAQEPWVLLALIPVVLLFVGPAEELFWRGAVQGRLRESMGPWAGILLAGVLFASVHALNYVNAGTDAVSLWMLADLTGIFVTGSVMGLLYEKTENLTAPILVHGLYDAVLLAVLYAGLL